MGQSAACKEAFVSVHSPHDEEYGPFRIRGLGRTIEMSTVRNLCLNDESREPKPSSRLIDNVNLFESLGILPLLLMFRETAYPQHSLKDPNDAKKSEACGVHSCRLCRRVHSGDGISGSTPRIRQHCIGDYSHRLLAVMHNRFTTNIDAICVLRST
jgi:hypothetical protein